MLANPLPGRIQAKSEPWAGHPTFRVTATFADHVARGSGGIDFGNGGCGAPVYAMRAGNISELIVDPGNGALIARVQHTPTEFSGYAHLSGFAAGLRRGQYVTAGTILGYVGKTGATACHLHAGYRIGCTGGNFYVGKEIDFWPMLQQNISPAAGGDMIQGKNPKRIVNRVAQVSVATARFRAAPATGTTAVLASYGVGTNFTCDWQVEGEVVGGSAVWYGGWGTTAKGLEFGYMHDTVLGELAPQEPTGGHSDDELVQAAKRGANQAAVAVATEAATKAKEYPAP